MTPARQALFAFVLDKLQVEPVAKRIDLYRALAAELSETEPAFQLLTSLADELETIEKKHKQLRLDLGDDDGKAGS
jgi:hypothetical protein